MELRGAGSATSSGPFVHGQGLAVAPSTTRVTSTSEVQSCEDCSCSATLEPCFRSNLLKAREHGIV
eukprot:4226391-Pyramimonas_sp.AAC.1